MDNNPIASILFRDDVFILEEFSVDGGRTRFVMKGGNEVLLDCLFPSDDDIKEMLRQLDSNESIAFFEGK